MQRPVKRTSHGKAPDRLQNTPKMVLGLGSGYPYVARKLLNCYTDKNQVGAARKPHGQSAFAALVLSRYNSQSAVRQKLPSDVACKAAFGSR